MGTCKTCRQWDNSRSGPSEGVCNDMAFVDSAFVSVPRNGIIFQQFATTGPDFGCIHHTPIDNPEGE